MQKCNRLIRDVKYSKLARKPNRNTVTKQNSVNPSNIAHTRRTGSLAVSRGVLYFNHHTHVTH